MKKKTLRQIRREKDLTQEELAERTGITGRRISQYETDINALRSAKYETLEKMANALGVGTDEIYLG